MSNAEACVSSPNLGEMFESVVRDLQSRLFKEMQKLDEALSAEDVSTEQRFKTYTGYFKMVQGVEMMMNGIRQQREQDREHKVSVVEFRRQLEEQISKLVDEETPETVSE